MLSCFRDPYAEQEMKEEEINPRVMHDQKINAKKCEVVVEMATTSL